MSQQHNLLPCPFCGGNAQWNHNEEQWHWIECTKCGASTNMRVSLMDDCAPILAEQWNRRATLPPEPVAVPEEWRNFVEMLVHDGALQTLSNREKFRKEASAMLAAAPPPSSQLSVTLDLKNPKVAELANKLRDVATAYGCSARALHAPQRALAWWSWPWANPESVVALQADIQQQETRWRFRTNLIREAADALDDLTPKQTPETSAARQIAQDLRRAIESIEQERTL